LVANTNHRASNELLDAMIGNHTRTTLAYCGPYGGAHVYRPIFVPDGVGLLRPPRRFRAFENVTRMIPVMRLEDHRSIHFFYYANGCSDMFIRADSRDALVAHDRIDALRRLANRKTAKLLTTACAHAIETAAVQLMPALLLRPSASVDITGIRASVTGSGCLNELLHGLMRERNLQTLVLNYEAPGSSTEETLFSRKTEVVYLGDTLYGADGKACAIRTLNKCWHCADSTLSRATCQGRLQMSRKLTIRTADHRGCVTA
jgi:hypothetical protein